MAESGIAALYLTSTCCHLLPVPIQLIQLKLWHVFTRSAWLPWVNTESTGTLLIGFSNNFLTNTRGFNSLKLFSPCTVYIKRHRSTQKREKTYIGSLQRRRMMCVLLFSKQYKVTAVKPRDDMTIVICYSTVQITKTSRTVITLPSVHLMIWAWKEWSLVALQFVSHVSNAWPQFHSNVWVTKGPDWVTRAPGQRAAQDTISSNLGSSQPRGS